MRLQSSTDYALRVLIYLGAIRGERFVPASEIAEAYGISAHHTSKICKDLTARGWLKGRRGAGGGVRLAVAPADLGLAEVVTALEPMELVECFAPDADDCVVSPACRLKSALREAQRAFVDSLAAYTLADLTRARGLRRLLVLD